MSTSTKERLLQQIEDERKSLERRLDVINALPIAELDKHFPQGNLHHFMGNSYEFTLPMDFSLIAKMKELAISKEWRTNKERQYIWDDKNAGTFLSIWDDTFYLDIAFRSSVAGSTCQIQKIGTEKKEVPVYEVTCGEGAKENTFGE